MPPPSVGEAQTLEGAAGWGLILTGRRGDPRKWVLESYLRGICHLGSGQSNFIASGARPGSSGPFNIKVPDFQG